MPVHSTLKKRKQFVSINKNCTKSVRKGLILQASPSSLDSTVRIGFTVTKKVGNAVVRNRVKRRLRALWQDLSLHTKSSYDYVIIGRFYTIDRQFSLLKKDLESCLKELDLYTE